jgi:hypothetical protein
MKIKRAQELYNSKLEMVAYAQLNEWPELRAIKTTLWILANKIGISRTKMQLDIDTAVPRLGPAGEGRLEEKTLGLRKKTWRTAPGGPSWRQEREKKKSYSNGRSGWIRGH